MVQPAPLQRTIAMTAPKPFKIEIAQARINRIMERVRDFEWPDAPDGGGWAYGTELAAMREIAEYWLHGYDWYAQQAALNRFPQFIAQPLDLDIHFIHVKSNARKRRPLIVSHGWPGSIVEFLNVIGPLAHPEQYGGNADDGFDIVVPSLPGYGFSEKPKKPIGPRLIAHHFDALMRESLGYEGYVAQGGDWGATISGWLGYEGKGCRAIHLNCNSWTSPGVTFDTEEEKKTQALFVSMFEAEGAYFRLQASKPLTLAYAMMDSPVGVAAWIVEKFKGWSDLDDGKLDSVFTKDQLLTNIMIYLVTRTFATSTWIYRAYMEEIFTANAPKGARVEKPTAFARFPKDMYAMTTRSQAEKSLNVVRWSEFKRGGHFAAMERPREFIADVRAFGLSLDR
jgi:microsomal epoxide hydrolase